MKSTTIWFAEDVVDDEQSGIGKTAVEAEKYVVDNRGYDSIEEAINDGGLKKAIPVDIPSAITNCVLWAFEVMHDHLH